jgi:hypothetical protein
MPSYARGWSAAKRNGAILTRIPLMPVPLDLVSVERAAEIAGVHPKTIRRWMQKRYIRYFGTRGIYRISMADLLPEVPSCSKAPAQSKAPTAKPRIDATASRETQPHPRAVKKSTRRGAFQMAKRP